MHDAASLKVRLLSQLETVLFHLLPGGVVKGHEFRAGSIAGEAGGSLVVELRGDKAGLWMDGASSDDKGDVFTLWMRVRNIDFPACLREVRNYLGISNVERPAKKPRPPAPDTSDVGRMKGTPVYDYLLSRRISEETMRLYRLRTHRRHSEHNKHFVCFTYAAPDGADVFLKSTGIAKRPDGKKDIWSTPPWWTLWGWWLVKPNHRELCIVEGELDACSLRQLFAADGIDIPVLSLPSGASNFDWIENDYDALNQFERIWLCPDQDPAGEEAAKKMAQRLGPGRCMRLPLPGTFKDANSVLTEAPEDFCSVGPWFEKAYSFDPPTLCSVNDIWEETMAAMERKARDADVNTFLFPEMAYQYRDSEMTIVAGYKGSGKSTWTYQTHLHEMRNGRKVLVCSWEIQPKDMLAELLWMTVGHKPTMEERLAVRGWLNAMVTFVRPPMDYGLNELCDDITYAAQRYGVSRVLVDSLHYLAPKEAYERQDMVSVSLHKLTHKLNIHLALVAHSPKGEPDKIPYVVEGSGGILKAPENCLTVWRNFTKEEQIEKAQEKGDEDAVKKAQALHDGVVVVWHQRLTGKHPRLKVWFSDVSRCYRTSAADVRPTALPTEPEDKELF